MAHISARICEVQIGVAWEVVRAAPEVRVRREVHLEVVV